MCGGVRYELSAPFRRANFCHCSRCRKHTGSIASPQGRVPREGFRLLTGEELLTVYKPEDGGMAKVFCSRCGSSLFGGTWPDGPEVSVRLGTLDGEPEVGPQFHSFRGEAAGWYALTDDLPSYEGYHGL